MIADKLETLSQEKDVDVTAEAAAIDNFKEVVADYDVVLLGPQVRYEQERLAEIAAEEGVPLDVIDSEVYGMMAAEKILKQALKLINDGN
jgi:PTS system cellobiose-specific IIB component